MSGRYREITYTAFKALMDEMRFRQVDLSNTMEFVFEHSVQCSLTANALDRFKIRIMSSVDVRSNVTREVGSDAIRVLLLDMQPTGKEPGQTKIVMDWSVHRTTNALSNTRERAREAYGYVSKHPEHHCSCGSLMALRTTKKTGSTFLGCTAFPACKETKPV